MAKILVTMPDEFLHKIDGFASNEQRSRSELIREALRSYMRKSYIRNPQKADDDAKILENMLGQLFNNFSIHFIRFGIS